MGQEPAGYRGTALSHLSAVNAQIGDILQIQKNGEIYSGILMPRYELADDQHIVLKMPNGYNIGIKITPNTTIERVGLGEKPAFSTGSTVISNTNLPTVSIISTGGTIASRIDYRTGAVHSALTADDICNVVPELTQMANIRTEILFSLFSENLRSHHWQKLAQSIFDHISKGAQGVVICHGTDTMAYTSAALSFALQNLPVPVLLVGSQRSSDRPSSDATENLINAIRVAAAGHIAEVMILMHDTSSDTTALLHRGTKVRKCHTSRRDAFQSVNTQPLAKIHPSHIEYISHDYANRDGEKQLIIKPCFDENVALIKFYPGFPPQLIRWYVNHSYRGIIFEGTGLGHLAENIYPEIKYAVDHGVVLGMTSQCLWGRVNMNVYTTGRDLQNLGVLPLHDMLPETAVIKMMWAFGQTQNIPKVKDIMLTNIAGEIETRSQFQNFNPCEVNKV
jgi:glutamyl-tRNA(Gln) amidotransferase subunit D